jgi:hypothetical protein
MVRRRQMKRSKYWATWRKVWKVAAFGFSTGLEYSIEVGAAVRRDRGFTRTLGAARSIVLDPHTMGRQGGGSGSARCGIVPVVPISGSDGADDDRTSGLRRTKPWRWGIRSACPARTQAHYLQTGRCPDRPFTTLIAGPHGSIASASEKQVS